MDETHCNLEPVGVLMCVYRNDDPRLLSRAIGSILSQTYKGERRIYLCIDGPIPQELAAIIEARHADFFYIHRNKSNIGLARSLNILISALKDEPYVFRMDADDYSLPERFTETISFMEAENIDVCGSWIEEFQVDSGVRRVVRYPRDHHAVMRMLPFGSPVAHPTVCFRRSVLQRHPAYPVKQSNEDIAFWFSLLKENCRFGNVQRVLLEFTVSPSFYERRARGKAFEELKIYMYGVYALRGISLTMLAPVARFCIRLLPKPLIKAAYHARRLIGR